MKRLLGIFLVIAMALFTFTACTDNATPPAEDTERAEAVETLPEEERTEDDTNPPEQEQKKEDNQPQGEKITKMYISINGNKAEIELAENSSADALVELLKEDDIVYTADDYGGFEKVGSLGHTLPTSNSEIITEAGDVILYSGNQIVLFYGSNKWSYTRLGKIKGYSASELRSFLCAGSGIVQVTLSLK